MLSVGIKRQENIEQFVNGFFLRCKRRYLNENGKKKRLFVTKLSKYERNEKSCRNEIYSCDEIEKMTRNRLLSKPLDHRASRRILSCKCLTELCWKFHVHKLNEEIFFSKQVKFVEQSRLLVSEDCIHIFRWAAVLVVLNLEMSLCIHCRVYTSLFHANVYVVWNKRETVETLD